MISNQRAQRKAKQLLRLCQVDRSLDENRVRRVVQQAIAAAHRDYPAVLKHFLRLVRLERAQQTAHIESAAPLPADLRASLEASLARRYTVPLALAFALRPSLIGGVRIQAGWDVYDGSVQAGLQAFEKRF